MAITAFTGPPGAGKSHALVKDVILPAIMAGRRVLTNIDGINPDAVRAYCLERCKDATTLGQLQAFHGDDARKAGFWPDEETPCTATVVKSGDLIVFDEWALYFPRRGQWPQGCNVEAFLRWHRHLTGEDGAATDVAIGTQLATDVHQNVRGLIARSYKFQKLTALGADKQYTWRVFEGHLQPKGGHYMSGTGTYDPEVFPLYASSAAAREGKHVELRTNKKDSIWSGGRAWAAVIVPIVLLAGGSFGLWTVFAATGTEAEQTSSANMNEAATVAGSPSAVAPRPVVSSKWRIVGHIAGDAGTRVIVSDDKGAIRVLRPDDFRFDEGRPIAGVVDGERVIAEERLPVTTGNGLASPFGGAYQ